MNQCNECWRCCQCTFCFGFDKRRTMCCELWRIEVKLAASNWNSNSNCFYCSICCSSNNLFNFKSLWSHSARNFSLELNLHEESKKKCTSAKQPSNYCSSFIFNNKNMHWNVSGEYFRWFFKWEFLQTYSEWVKNCMYLQVNHNGNTSTTRRCTLLTLR